MEKKEPRESDFVSLYFVDLEDGTYDIYQVNGLRPDVKRVAQENMDYGQAMHKYIETFVEPKYKELLYMGTDLTYIRNHLAKKPEYYLEYEVVDNPANQKHFELHFIRTEQDQDTRHVVVGWRCVDEKYDQKAAQDELLQQTKDDLDYQKQLLNALGGIYISMHVIYVKDDRFKEIRSANHVHAVLEGYESAREGFVNIIKHLVTKPDVEVMTKFLDLDTLDKRVRGKSMISQEFFGATQTWVRAMFIPTVWSEDGELLETLFLVQTIDEEKRRELNYQRAVKEAYEDTNYIYREMIRMQMAGVVAIWEEEPNQIITLNNGALHLLDIEDQTELPKTYPALLRYALRNGDEIASHFLQRLKNPSVNVAYELRIELNSGRVRNLLDQSKRLTLANGDKVIINTLSDITKQKLLEHDLTVLSEIDGLTGIRNRMSGEQAIRLYTDTISSGGMFCLFDIDNFKHYNDTFGHAFGDEVIKAVAKSMQRVFRSNDIIMRLGGDEYAVFVTGQCTLETATGILQRLIRDVEHISLEGLDRQISISIGAVICSDDASTDFDAMYRQADGFMYECKKQKGSAFIIDEFKEAVRDE